MSEEQTEYTPDHKRRFFPHADGPGRTIYTIDSMDFIGRAAAMSYLRSQGYSHRGALTFLEELPVYPNVVADWARTLSALLRRGPSIWKAS